MDIKTGEYLANKSSQILDNQIDVYREKKSTIRILFVLNLLTIIVLLTCVTTIWLKFFVILPIILFLQIVYFFIKSHQSKPLERGLAVTAYDEAINKSYEDALLFEIGVNRDSFLANKSTLKKLTLCYEGILNITKFVVMVSIVLLTLNLFVKCKSNTETQKIEIVK